MITFLALAALTTILTCIPLNLLLKYPWIPSKEHTLVRVGLSTLWGLGTCSVFALLTGENGRWPLILFGAIGTLLGFFSATAIGSEINSHKNTEPKASNIRARTNLPNIRPRPFKLKPTDKSPETPDPVTEDQEKPKMTFPPGKNPLNPKKPFRPAQASNQP